MGNVFGGGGLSLDLSNGATDVFVDALALAVSELADHEWDFRFAALLTWQNQDVLGRGFVGFDLEDVDWGATPPERARAKDFVLRATALARAGHRRAELGYEAPFADGYLDRFRAMVESFEPSAHTPPAGRFPSADEGAVASCVRHRVLSALPHWQGCFLCTRR
ncbi:hypothetical protein [Streptomyces sp. G45]|uniref:hypothetical protein n=1 Tax=Streptomyces sp. G45 TaxID=3406627 RepID=UPI003C27D2D4